MKISEIEMQGLISGKCLPGDMRQNESLPAFLVRKFTEQHEKLSAVMAENSALINYIDSECYVESQRSGIYSCAGISKPATPATDAILNGVRAEGAMIASQSISRAVSCFQGVHAGAVMECADIAREVGIGIGANAAKDGE